MKIVYTYIVADVLHTGHLLYLEGAKTLGDILIVGVLTDEAVEEKKPTPIISFKERLEIVKNLKMVDIAVPQETYSPGDNILSFNPNIIVESGSHDETVLNRTISIARSIKAQVIVFPYWTTAFESSSGLKKRISSKKIKA